jgi:hypothetical protein
MQGRTLNSAPASIPRLRRPVIRASGLGEAAQKAVEAAAAAGA